MNVFVFSNIYKDHGLVVTKQAVQFLLQHGAHVILLQECRVLCNLTNVEYLPKEQAYEKADLVISVGGDGTLLHAGKECIRYGLPILGINAGRLGFLATCEVSELPQKIIQVMDGDYELDERQMLECHTLGSVAWHANALNDVVVYAENRLQTADFSIYCDGILVNRFSSDGVIIATPTGSTAYSLSAGGPIMDAHIAGFVVTPICAHRLKSPAMVFSADRKLTIRAIPRYGDTVYVSCDGSEKCALAADSTVEVALSSKKLKLISLSPAEQFEAIDKKLMGR